MWSLVAVILAHSHLASAAFQPKATQSVLAGTYREGHLPCGNHESKQETGRVQGPSVPFGSIPPVAQLHSTKQSLCFVLFYFALVLDRISS